MERLSCNAARARYPGIPHSSGDRPFMCSAVLFSYDGLDREQRRVAGRCHCGMERSVSSYEQMKKDRWFAPIAWDLEEHDRIGRAHMLLRLGMAVMVVLVYGMFG